MENPINRDQEDYPSKFFQEEVTINYIGKTHEQLDEALEVNKKRGAEMRKFRAKVTGKDARFHGNQTILHACNEYDLLFAQTRRVPLGEAFLKTLSNRDFLSVPECHDWWRVAYWNVFSRLKEFFQGVHGAATSMEGNYKQAEWTVFEIK